MTQGVQIENVAEIKARIISVLESSIHGTFIEACQIAGLSKTEGYRWRKEDAQFEINVKKARAQGIQSGLDFVEGKLVEHIAAGNVTAAIFYLKCHGKDRGYIDRIMHGFDKDNPLPPVQVIHDATDRFRSILESLADAKASGSPVTITLAGPGPSVSSEAQRQLENLADHGGARMGQDENRG